MRKTKHNSQFLRLLVPLLLVLASCLALFNYRLGTPALMHVRMMEGSVPAAGEDEDDGASRADWFYAQRAYPLKAVPVGARLHAIEQLEREETRLKQRSATASRARAAKQPAWTALGPAPIGQGQTYGTPRVAVSGRVSAIALDPGYNGTTNQTLYLGAAQGGVWRSRDNGTSWTPLTDDQPSLAIGAIALDPTHPNIIYAGTGEGNPVSCSSYYGAGLLKSTDGGATWTQITGPTAPFASNPAFINAGFPRIVVDPIAPSTVYACTSVGHTNSASESCIQTALLQRGVWKTTDGGLTWRNLDPSNTGGSNQASDLVIDPLNHNQIFTALFDQGIYRSTNGGEGSAWQKLTNGLPATSLASAAIVAAFGSGLATRTEVAATLPLPTTLAGTTVRVRDRAGTERAAPLFFVSPNQINYQVPPETALGPAVVTAVSGDATVSIGTMQIAAVAPGLFSANADGQGAPAAVLLRVRADGTQSTEPVAQFNSTTKRFESAPIDLGPEGEQVFLIAFGTGFRQRSALDNVNCTLGGVRAEVIFARAQGDFAGLDQTNLKIPRSLAGRGNAEVVFTVDGKRANTVMINLKLNSTAKAVP